MLNGLDICAGSGVGSLAFERAGLSRTVCYIERDPYCQRIIEQRQRDGWLSPAPIWDDLRTFNGRPWRGCVDFIFGGIPCQPYSCAGKQRGAADERDLWPDTRRIIREVGPRLVLIENVTGLLARPDWMGRILGELAEDGFDAEWATVSAADVGAWHLRKRVWIVAYARDARPPRAGGRDEHCCKIGIPGDEGAEDGRGIVAYAASRRREAGDWS
jgi:DNA (cytosine-5)-methyltransferase 1